MEQNERKELEDALAWILDEQLHGAVVKALRFPKMRVP